MAFKHHTRKVSLTGKIEFTNIKLKDPMTYAAGKLGVKEALRHSFKEMGVVRSMKALVEMNQEDGFDCPSCAWPNPENPSKIAEYCENGAKALADEATTHAVDSDFFKKFSVEELSELSDYQLNKLGRLHEPVVLKEGSIHYEPISWDEAYTLIAEKLKTLDSADDAIFYTSGRSSNEAAFLYGMFARAFGTNNMPDCSNMCHESSGVALSETLGIGKGSIKLEDLYEAEVVIVAGQNPGTNHPRMLSALEKCKKNGGKVISINPLQEAGLVNFKNPQHLNGLLGSGENMADIHLAVGINQDVPLVKYLLKRLVELDQSGQNVFDHDFISNYTKGYESLMSDLDNYDKDELLQRCGIPKEQMEEVVQLLANNSKIVVCWAMGLTQHKNGVENIREFVNLLLLKGAIGKPHAGTCPVRGHSNVQGDRSVGIMHYVDEAFNQRIEKELGFKPPYEEGVDVVGALKAMHDKENKVFICLGGNFLMAANDTEYTARAIQNCALTVQISTKLNRTHLVTGKTALILPTYGRSEKDTKEGTVRYQTMEDSMGRVRQSQGLLKPASGNIKSEPELIAEMAHAYFGENHSVPWLHMASDYDLVRSYIDKVVKGFDNTSERSKGIGYYLPNNVRKRDFSMLPESKAQFTINTLPEYQLAENQYLLMTIRSHDQFNTTIYGLDDRYRGIYNERRVIFMNRDDMTNAGFVKLDIVDILSHYDGIERKAEKFLVIPYDIPKGNLAAYFPETNMVVPYNRYADRSKTPISKSIIVSLNKVGN